MQGWRFRIRHQVGRAASLVAVLLAVVMLVAGGASHELLHADEAEAPSTQVAAVKAMPVAAAHVADVKIAGGKTGADHTAPVHSCSGHCAAHTANAPPAVLLVSAPVAMTAKWRLDRGHAASLHPSTGPDRPPRA